MIPQPQQLNESSESIFQVVALGLTVLTLLLFWVTRRLKQRSLKE